MKLRIRNNQMEEVEGLHSHYPYAYHYVDLQTTAVPWHWHEALEFNLVLEGTVKVSTPSQTFTIRRGEAFFTNSNVLTSMEGQPDCIMDSHLFHPVLLSGHFQSIFETKYIAPITQNRQMELIPIRNCSEPQRLLLQKLHQLSKLQCLENAEFQTRNLLSEIWLLLLDVIRTMPTASAAPSKNQDRLLTMLVFVQDHFSDKLTLDEIAASASISPRECLRCFQSTIRQSPMEYLMDYRIQQAKKLLETTDFPVTEVAIRCGFNSSAYFTKQFHRLCEQTPTEYRKKCTQKTPP